MTEDKSKLDRIAGLTEALTEARAEADGYREARNELGYSGNWAEVGEQACERVSSRILRRIAELEK